MRSTRARNTRALAVAAVAAGLLAGGVTTGAMDVFTSDKPTDTVANAAASRPAPDCVADREVRNVTFVKTVKVWPNKDGYLISSWGPGQLRMDYKMEVASKVSATFGMTKGKISAGVGFDVTETISKMKGVSLTMEKHAHYTGRAGEVYKQYRFDAYEKRGKYHWFSPTAAICAVGPNPWVKVGTGTATQFWQMDHRLTKGRIAR
ncbi:hypothetical protein OH805_20975 [Streptomyces sp. NBC_00879]|uniref:hypothetical protein n=1 Tax=Streptomyces sp. NBC_00879 TaxID=2975855 RepID=UPI003866BF38|nr:hypothetical protein OH805_20975 [Streptomyces sp. NBC_00879]